jgi:predicted GNAT family acetyltransferase
MNFNNIYETINKDYFKNTKRYLSDFEKLCKDILVAEQKLFKVPLKTYCRPTDQDGWTAGAYNNEARTKEKRIEIIDNEECEIGDDRIEFEFGIFLFEQNERTSKYINKGDTGWLKIYNIALPFKYRGKGLGQKMTEECLKVLKKYGKINKVVLHDFNNSGYWDRIVDAHPEFEWVT